MKNEIKQDLEKMFVDEYDFVKKLRDTINKYFKESGVDFIYTYDDFCIEMLVMFDKFKFDRMPKMPTLMMVPILVNELILSKIPLDMKDKVKGGLKINF